MIPQRWIEAYLKLLLRHRVAVIAVVGVLTACFSYTLLGLHLHTDFVDFYPPRHPYIRFYNEFRKMFGTPNVMSVILEVKHGDIYNPATLQKLDRITKYMVFTRGVVPYRIYSIAHPAVNTVSARHGAVEIRPIFYPHVPETQEEADIVRFAVFANPAVNGIYTSTDGTAAVVHTYFWEEALDYGYLHHRLLELKRTEEDENHAIYITGFPWLYTCVLQYATELYTVFAFTLAALAFLLYAYFRTWTGIWVPVFSALLSSVWGLGLASLLGFSLDPLLLVIPIFLTARALSHSVQSMDRYHEEFYRRRDRNEAIVVSYSHLFAPAIASIVTDGLTLLVVAVAPIPIIQKVGIFASFWVVSIFVSVVTLHPVILSYIEPPPERDPRAPRWRAGSARAATAGIGLAGALALALAYNQLLSGRTAFLALAPLLVWYWLKYSERAYPAITRAVIACSQGKQRSMVITATVALALLLPFWGWRLKVGDMTPGAALLFPDHPYNVAADKLNQKFLGSSQLIIMADTRRPEGVKSEAVLHTIEELGDHMEAARGVGRAVTVVDIVKQVSRLLRDGDPKWATVPVEFEKQNTLVFALNAVSNSGAMFLDQSGRYSAVIALFHEHSHDVINGAIDWAKAFTENLSDDTVRFRYAGGLFGILAAVNEAVEDSYWLNLVLIFGIVLSCIWLTYRSWTAAVVLLIPVVLSQLAAEAFMVLFHIDLNVNSLPIAAAGAGVGVDYGIYHFSRMIEAYREMGDLDRAVDHATATTGKAILFTASTMIAGTAFWWFSNLKFQAEMGFLLALLMVFNTIGGLVVVPSLVKTLRPRFPARR